MYLKTLSTLAHTRLCRHHHLAFSQPNVYSTNQTGNAIFFLWLLSCLDAVSYMRAADNWHWKGNYSLQRKRIFLLLKQVNARSSGHVSTMHIASRSSPTCRCGHLMSTVLYIDMLLKANKQRHHQSNGAEQTLLEANTILHTCHVHHPCVLKSPQGYCCLTSAPRQTLLKTTLLNLSWFSDGT